MPKSTPHFMERGVDKCRLIDFPIVASGQIPQPFREWLGKANDQMLLKSKKKNFICLQDVFGLGWPLSEDFTGVRTSSTHYLWRRHLDSKMTAPIMTSTKTWGGLFDPYRGVRSKMAALPLPSAIFDDIIYGTGNEVIRDCCRKRKGRHLASHSSMGSKRPPHTPNQYDCSISIFHQISHQDILLYWLVLFSFS